MTNDVVATQNNTPAMPDYLAGYAQSGVGQVQVDMKELRMPILKMIQLQGDAYDATKDNFGNITDSIANEDFGSSLQVVVVDYTPEWLKWSADRKMLGKSTDGVTWSTGDASYVGKTLVETEGKDAFKCKHYNYIVLILENGVPRKLPYKLSLSGMSAKAGDKIYQILAQKAIANGYPMFAFTFSISTSREKGEKGQFSMFHAEVNKEFAPKAVADMAAEMIKTIKDPSIKIVEEDAAPSTPPPAPAQEAAPQAPSQVW